MALLNIREDGDPILRKISKEVKEITPRIKELVEDMTETMNHAYGVGLAAPQVGILKRVILVDISTDEEEDDLHVFINPEITYTEGKCNGSEGCLSVPGIFGTVDRPEKIRVRYLDINGQEMEMEAEDFLARAICHEVDHLNGILFTDKEEFQELEPENED